MRSLIPFLLLLCPLLALGQYTAVTAQVQDPSGNLYANCSYNVDLVANPNGNDILKLDGQQGFQTNFVGVRCDSSANLSITLPSTDHITPTGAQWRFSICSQTGSYCFKYTGTVTGTTLSLTSALRAVAAALPTTSQPAGLSNDNTFTGNNSFKNLNGILFADQWGLAGDGTTDNTAAFNALIAAACLNGYREIYFKPGQYLFASRPNPIGCGIWLRGAGNGTTSSFETSLLDAYSESTATNGFLTWDGSYSSFAGTGGGIQNVSIYKTTANGGTAIKVTGSGDNNRAGFFTIRDVVVSASGGATWNKGLIIDGSCCTTSGGQGVRDIFIENFWPAIMSDGDTSILFNNAVQVFWFGGEVFPASGGGSTGITITGAGSGTSASTNIFLTSVYIVGNLSIDYVSTFQAVNTFVGGNFTSTTNSQGCAYRGQIGGTLTNTGNCEITTQNNLVTGASTLFKGTTNQFNNAVGIGGAPSGSAALTITGTPFSGASQFGIAANSTFSHQATTFAASFSSAPNTEDFAFTIPTMFGFYSGLGTKGAASTITLFTGHGCVHDLNFGGTNRCFDSGTGNPNYFYQAQIDTLKVGSSGSNITDSRELLQSVHACGTTSTCSNTANGSYREVWGTITLSTGAATLTGITAFTSTSSFGCSCTDQTSVAVCKAVPASTTSVTFAGTGSDVLFYRCIGN